MGLAQGWYYQNGERHYFEIQSGSQGGGGGGGGTPSQGQAVPIINSSGQLVYAGYGTPDYHALLSGGGHVAAPGEISHTYVSGGGVGFPSATSTGTDYGSSKRVTTTIPSANQQAIEQKAAQEKEAAQAAMTEKFWHAAGYQTVIPSQYQQEGLQMSIGVPVLLQETQTINGVPRAQSINPYGQSMNPFQNVSGQNQFGGGDTAGWLREQAVNLKHDWTYDVVNINNKTMITAGKLAGIPLYGIAAIGETFAHPSEAAVGFANVPIAWGKSYLSGDFGASAFGETFAKPFMQNPYKFIGENEAFAVAFSFVGEAYNRQPFHLTEYGRGKYIEGVIRRQKPFDIDITMKESNSDIARFTLKSPTQFLVGGRNFSGVKPDLVYSDYVTQYPKETTSYFTGTASEAARGRFLEGFVDEKGVVTSRQTLLNAVPNKPNLVFEVLQKVEPEGKRMTSIFENDRMIRQFKDVVPKMPGLKLTEWHDYNPYPTNPDIINAPELYMEDINMVRTRTGFSGVSGKGLFKSSWQPEYSEFLVEKNFLKAETKKGRESFYRKGTFEVNPNFTQGNMMSEIKSGNGSFDITKSDPLFDVRFRDVGKGWSGEMSPAEWKFTRNGDLRLTNTTLSISRNLRGSDVQYERANTIVHEFGHFVDTVNQAKYMSETRSGYFVNEGEPFWYGVNAPGKIKALTSPKEYNLFVKEWNTKLENRLLTVGELRGIYEKHFGKIYYSMFGRNTEMNARLIQAYALNKDLFNSINPNLGVKTQLYLDIYLENLNQRGGRVFERPTERLKTGQEEFIDIYAGKGAFVPKTTEITGITTYFKFVDYMPEPKKVSINVFGDNEWTHYKPAEASVFQSQRVASRATLLYSKPSTRMSDFGMRIKDTIGAMGRSRKGQFAYFKDSDLTGELKTEITSEVRRYPTMDFGSFAINPEALNTRFKSGLKLKPIMFVRNSQSNKNVSSSLNLQRNLQPQKNLSPQMGLNVQKQFGFQFEKNINVQVEKQVNVQRQFNIQKQFNLQKQMNIQMQVQRQQILNPGIDLRMFGFGNPPITPISFFRPRKNESVLFPKLRGERVGVGYLPSLTATLFNIRGKRPGRFAYSSGFNIRPL